MTTKFSFRDGLDEIEVSVNTEVVKSYIRDCAHRYAVSSATRIHSHATSTMAKLGMAPLSQYQSVDWDLMRRIKGEKLNTFTGHFSQALQKGMRGNGEAIYEMRLALYKMYTSRFKAAEKVRQDAHKVKVQNGRATDALNWYVQKATQVRDGATIVLSVLAVPASSGFVIAAAGSVALTAVGKYQDTNGNLGATSVAALGATVGLGFSVFKLPGGEKVVTVVSTAVEGLFEGAEALAEGKNMEQAITGALTKVGCSAGAHFAGHAAAKYMKGQSRLAYDQNQLALARLDSKAVDQWRNAQRFVSNADASGMNAAAAGGILAKELGRDPLSATNNGRAPAPRTPMSWDEFSEYARTAVWMSKITRITDRGNPDVRKRRVMVMP
ncbi:MAG: hypothetical protein AAF666_08625 [Pseudomonadota bacterium]